MESPTYQQDLTQSLMLLSYLHAACQGSLAFSGFLSELKAHSYHEETKLATQRTLTKIGRWTEVLQGGTPLISPSWSKPETFEARELFDTVMRVREELKEAARDCTRILSSRSYVFATEDTKILLAHLARSVYSQAYFIKSMTTYAQSADNPQLLADFLAIAPEADKDLSNVHQLIDALKEREFQDKSYFDVVHLSSRQLSTRFQTQVHDLTVFLATYPPGFTFELASIGPEEAKRWTDLGVGPLLASFWRAHDVGPEETAAWRQIGAELPSEAREWRDEGFSPSDALLWKARGFRAEEAANWKNAHYTPEQAQAAKREEESGTTLISE